MITIVIKNQRVVLIFIMLLVISACTGIHSTIASSTITYTFMPTIESTTNPSLSILPSEIPTKSVEELYKNLINLVQNEKCVLPCLVGINPSISTMKDVHNLFLPFQAITNFGGLPLDTEGGLNIQYPLDTTRSVDINIYYFPSSIKKDMLDHIFLGTKVWIIGGSGDDPKIFVDMGYHQLFQRYNLTTIMSSFGRPSQVFISVMPSTGAEPGVASYFDLRLAYPDKGFYISYYSLAQELDNLYKACPANSFIAIWSEAPTIGLSISELESRMADWPGRDFALGFKPLELATNLTIDQFYQTFIKASDNCIDTPKSAWLTY